MRKTKTIDGNTVAAIYPINLSSPMAEHIDEWVAKGEKNIFGQPVKVIEMQSEAGDPDADRIIISMGAVNDVAEETVNYLNANKKKVGLVKVRLYRLFSDERLLKVIPNSVRKIAALDRTKELGSIGEPLYLDIVKAFFVGQYHL